MVSRLKQTSSSMQDWVAIRDKNSTEICPVNRFELYIDTHQIHHGVFNPSSRTSTPRRVEHM